MSDPVARLNAALEGRYTVKRELGEGGMGVVYLAEQLEPLRRQVALKVLRPGVASTEALARFKAEQQTLAKLLEPVHDDQEPLGVRCTIRLGLRRR